MQPRFPSFPLVALLLAGLFAPACKDSGTGPTEAGPPAVVQIVSGNVQQGTVGQELSQPLVVKVMDSNGNPVSGQVINFRVTAGGGSVFAGASSTNSSGIAQERWTLGTVALAAQALEVRAVDNTTGAPLVFATFTATAKAGAPTAAVKESGDGQTGAAGALLTVPVAVKVTDSYGNVVPGASVVWVPGSGAGSLSAATSNTDASGIASVLWTLGTAAGPKTLTATVGSLPAISFTATASAGSASSLQLVSGSGQTQTAGTRLSGPIVVKLTDQHGNPVTGSTVSFSATSGGLFSPVSVPTDAQGIASSHWTLGGAVGSQDASITTAGTAPVSVSAVATAGAASRIVLVSGNQQTGVALQPLQLPLVVRVTDANYNPIANATVNWSTPAACGSVAPASSTADAGGQTQAQWTLGSSGAACATGVTATIAAGSSVTFIATVTGNSAGSLSAGNFSDLVGAIATPIQLTAYVRDAFGNSVPGVTVAWALSSGTGVFSSSSSFTDVAGQASITFTPGTVAGNNFVNATVAGVGSVRYLVWTKAAAPVRITIRGGNSQTGPIGQPLTDSISVRVEDQYGNGVFQQPVQFAVTAGGGYTERLTLTTDTLGAASTRLIPGSMGANSATVTWNGQTVPFSATGTAGTGQSVLIVSGNEQAVQGPTVSSYYWVTLPQPLVVKVVDGQGQPVSGVQVTWQGLRVCAPTTTGTNGLTSCSPQVPNELSVVITASVAASVATFRVILTPSGAGVYGYPVHTGDSTARVGTRLPGPVIVPCYDRQGGPGSCRVAVTGPGGTGSGGTLLPVPGYRRPGETAYYWILPSQPGKYYFWVYAPLGTNGNTATATP